jgi:hypothetical protein
LEHRIESQQPRQDDLLKIVRVIGHGFMV